jgi:ABC-2 type transport system ATP-binding protein
LLDTPYNIKSNSGVGDILQVRVKEISETLADEILNSLSSKFIEKKYSDGFLYLGADNLLELVPEVSNVTKAHNVHIEDMTVRKRTLEDAFIAMTGRGLRE